MIFSDDIPSFIPLNEIVDKAVRGYTEDIINYMAIINPKIKYEVYFDMIANDDHTEKAVEGTIQSEYGFITIFPDFTKNSAQAAMLNMGLIKQMELEGFDDTQITDAKIYSALAPYEEKYPRALAVYLTNDLKMQGQIRYES